MRMEILFVGGTLKAGPVDVPFSTAVYFEEGDRRIIVDPGSFATHKTLEKRLSDLDLKAEDITDVVLTHFHLDHAYASRYFENATVYLHKAYKEKDPSKFGDIVGREYVSVMKSWKKVKELEGGETLFGKMRVYHTPWHAREHISLLVETENYGMVFLPGDICFTRLDYFEMYKGYRHGRVAEFVLEMAKKADLIVFTHDDPIEPLNK